MFSCSLNGSVFLFSEVEWTEIIAKRRRIRRWCHWEPRTEFNECHWFHWTIELVLARFFFSSRPCDALRREVGLSSMVPSALGIYFFDLFWRYQMLFHASIAAHKWIAFYLMRPHIAMCLSLPGTICCAKEKRLKPMFLMSSSRNAFWHVMRNWILCVCVRNHVQGSIF